MRFHYNPAFRATVVACFIIFGCSVGAGEPESADPVTVANHLLDTWGGRRTQLEEARRILEEALVRDPRNYRALKELARYQMKSNYIAERPQRNGKYGYTVGEYEPGTLELAEQTLRKALAINPEYGDGLVSLGFVYTEARRFDEARAALKKAQQVDPGNLRAELKLSGVDFNEGNLDGALAHCVAAEKLRPSDPSDERDVYACSLQVYVAEGNRARAVEYHRKLVDFDPQDAWARGNFSVYLRSTVGDFDLAVQYAREAVGILNYGIGYQALAYGLYAKWADVLIREGRPESEAEPYFQEAYSIDPDLDDLMAFEGAELTGGNLVRALMRRGISINARSEKGSTALLMAVSNDRTEVVKSLLDLGADPNIASRNGWTPLLSAADKGNEQAVMALLEHAADRSATKTLTDPETQSRCAYTAAELAERKGFTKLAETLKSFGGSD